MATAKKATARKKKMRTVQQDYCITDHLCTEFGRTEVKIRDALRDAMLAGDAESSARLARRLAQVKTAWNAYLMAWVTA